MSTTIGNIIVQRMIEIVQSGHVVNLHLVQPTFFQFKRLAGRPMRSFCIRKDDRVQDCKYDSYAYRGTTP